MADAARLIVPEVTDALLSEIVSKIVKHFHPEKIGSLVSPVTVNHH
ncbi:MAG: hypothetical protein U9N36_04685 [Euryarchaeota archaeon]|nr:hypothetical protein [Euryarchaeota archaeon]